MTLQVTWDVSEDALDRAAHSQAEMPNVPGWKMFLGAAASDHLKFSAAQLQHGWHTGLGTVGA